MGTARGVRAALPSRRSGRRVVAATLATLLLSATGCARQQPSVVAYVGDGEVTQQELDAAYPPVAAALRDVQEVSQAAVINVMIYGELSLQIARERGIAITDAQRDRLLAGSELTPLLADPGAKGVAYDIADQQIVAQKLGAEAFLAEVGEREVKLNPRFGVLDPQQKIIAADQSGSLSTPAALAPVPQ